MYIIFPVGTFKVIKTFSVRVERWDGKIIIANSEEKTNDDLIDTICITYVNNLEFNVNHTYNNFATDKGWDIDITDKNKFIKWFDTLKP